MDSLVGESVDGLVGVLANLLVGSLEPEAHGPGGSRRRDRERCGGAQGDGVARSVGVHP